MIPRVVPDPPLEDRMTYLRETRRRLVVLFGEACNGVREVDGKIADLEDLGELRPTRTYTRC